MGSGISSDFQTPFKLKQVYQQKSLLQTKKLIKLSDNGYGASIVRQHNHNLAILISKSDINGEICDNLNKLDGRLYRNICNLLDYSCSTIFLLCGYHKQIEALFEFQDYNLEKDIVEKSKQKKSFTAIQVLKILKFMIDVIDQHKQYKLKNIQFNLQSIIFKNSTGYIKYANYHQIMLTQRAGQTFFCPQKCLINFPNIQDSSSIFSVGMVLLSMIIVEDCSDCYDFKHMRFCQSIFQQKIDKMNQITARNKHSFSEDSFINGISDDQILFEEQLNLLVRQTTICSKQRLNLNNLKLRYQNLLQKLAENNQNLYLGSKSFPKLVNQKGKHDTYYTKQRSFKTEQNNAQLHCYSTQQFALLSRPGSNIKQSTNLMKKQSSKTALNHSMFKVKIGLSRAIKNTSFKENQTPY